MKMTFRTIIIGGILVFFAVVMVVVFIPGWSGTRPDGYRPPLYR